ncbi:non-ribosomal peptide synthetase [Sphaerisporangium fuscum]|uniref:non-ribosomal peptide synthetase n=1 Tax=Sphaerisporangium fuscum TaxID=2835868 RepID=UPI001BDC9943|nr:non-ribosomal peptide synthetase [Sphaerisporangium fuscum]
MTTPSVLLGPELSFEDGDRIEELVEAWARVRPHAPAVRWKGRDLSYAGLVSRAERVAAALGDLGIGGSQVVAVRASRGPEMIAALLAVLKSRAVYTAIPVEWPQARVEDVLRRTGARVCLADAPGPTLAGVPTVGLGELLDGSAASRRDELPPAGAAVPDDACCVFFTSGSTGTPKCVLSPHLGTLRVARESMIGFGAHTVMLQSAPVAWDGFGFEVWCPLVSGGTTVLRESEHFGYDDLRTAVAQGVNTVFLTPTLFNATVDDDIDALQGVQAALLGGEKASAKHIATAMRAFPGLRVLNLYGPVEATMCPTGYVADGREEDEVPIGTPIASTGVYLLDDDRQVVPVGEAGEIAVSGVGLALCYLGDEEETARRFPVLPLGGDGAGVRVYLTGDLGVVGPDGLIRYRGRKDRQLKVRGVRVDPGEVEQALCALEGIGSAVVVPLPAGGPTVEALAAFYTAGGDGPAEAEVHAEVAARFPAAFVPNIIRRVAALPVTSIGKIDHEALAALLGEEAGGAAGDGEAFDGTLGVVLGHVRELLGRPVRPEDDIFHQGATSIVAIQLANRIGRDRGVELPVSVFLRGRTPARMAEALDDPSFLPAPIG